MGHLEGISGLGGLLKIIVALEEGLIPPNANFERMNPDTDAEFYHTQVSFLVLLPSLDSDHQRGLRFQPNLYHGRATAYGGRH